VLATVAVGWWAAPLAAVVLVTIVAIRWLALRKIGGISGDVLGTCEQIAECLCLVVLAGLAAHYTVHVVW
jgi:cobalamin synthase